MNRGKDRVRYAVVGLGHLAQVAVLPAFKNTRNSELTALVSGDAEKLRKLGTKYDLEHVYSYDEYDRALSQVDAVYLVLPNHLHREYAVRAAERGVHVLCEKPMAVTEQDCAAMIKAAERNRVKLMIAYRLHFETANLEAINLVKSGRLGNPRIFDSVFGQQVDSQNIRMTEPVKKGGGPVYDMGVYCINAARYLFQEEPIGVLAFNATSGGVRKGNKQFKSVNEMTSVLLRFPEERLATFTCSFGSADVSRYTLIGTKGALTMEPAYDYTLALEHHLVIGEKTSTRKFAKGDQFAAELIYFSDCILKGKEPEPSGWEGLADVRIVRAIYESARTGKLVKLPGFHAKKKPSTRQEIHRPFHKKPKIVNASSPSGE